MKRLSLLVCCVALLCLLAPAQTLTTGLVSPAGTLDCVYFDLIASNNLTVSSLDVEFAPGVTAATPVQVWVTRDRASYLGRLDDPASWELLGTADPNIPFTPNGGWTPLNLDLDLYLKSDDTCGVMLYRGTETGTLGQLTGTAQPSTGIIAATNLDISLRSGFDANYFENFATPLFPLVPNINVHYTVAPTHPVQIRTNRILAPVFDDQSCKTYTASEPVTVEFINLGTTSLATGTVIPINATIDGFSFQVNPEVLTTSVAPGATFTLTNTVNLSLPFRRRIAVTHNLSSDTYPLDNTAETEVFFGGKDPVVAIPHSENFDRVDLNGQFLLPPGWVQERTDATGVGSEWRVSTGSTTPGASAPLADHTTGIPGMGGFLAIDEATLNLNVSMRSPCIDLSTLAFPECRFWLHAIATSGGTDTFSVDVYDEPTGLITTNVLGPIGNIGPGWQQQTVNLSAFVGNRSRVIFRGRSYSPGNQFCVDDFTFLNNAPQIGQAPQVEFAVLEIGAAMNGQASLVSLGQAGPYFVDYRQGDNMLMSFSGVPKRAVILRAIFLNPQIATYANLGQFDIGGALNLITGLPTGLLLIGDGTQTTGLNPFLNTGVAGTGSFSTTIPSFPLGVLATFQCAMYTDGSNVSFLALSNAVQVTIVPQEIHEHTSR